MVSGGDISVVDGELGGAAFQGHVAGGWSEGPTRCLTEAARPRSRVGRFEGMIRKHRVVIVDDEPNIGSSLRLILEGEGYGVTVCESVTKFRAERFAGRADLYLLDVRLPDGSGLDVLKALKQGGDPAAVVMISGHGTIQDAIEATRNGAFDFLEKPLARDRVLLVVKNALERLGPADREPEVPRPGWRAAANDRQRARRSGARSPKRRRWRSLMPACSWPVSPERARSCSRPTFTARAGSPSRAFVKVNCAAIPTELIESELFGHEKGAFTGAAGLRRGKFELADGGTIFLDEVGDLHEASQAKLLRVLQDGEVQRLGGEQPIRVAVRIISATNRQLDLLIAEGKFRQDLFYRLSVVPIRVPAAARAARRHRGSHGLLPRRFLRAQQLQAEGDG